jgi:hypothetical protein
MSEEERALFVLPPQGGDEDLQELRYDVHESIHLSVITLDRSTDQLKRELQREKWTLLVVECLSNEEYEAFKKIQEWVVGKVDGGCSLIYYRHYSLCDAKFVKDTANKKKVLVVSKMKKGPSSALGLLRHMALRYDIPLIDTAMVAANERFLNAAEEPPANVSSRGFTGGLSGWEVKNTLEEPIFLVTRCGKLTKIDPGNTLAAPTLLDGSYSVGSYTSTRALLIDANGRHEPASPKKEETKGGDAATPIVEKEAPVAQEQPKTKTYEVSLCMDGRKLDAPYFIVIFFKDGKRVETRSSTFAVDSDSPPESIMWGSHAKYDFLAVCDPSPYPTWRTVKFSDGSHFCIRCVSC